MLESSEGGVELLGVCVDQWIDDAWMLIFIVHGMGEYGEMFVQFQML